MSVVEMKMKNLGVDLPGLPGAVGNYVPAVRTGSLVVTSGQLPFVGRELAFKGHVGREIDETDAQAAAKLCVLNALAAIKSLIGDLDKITRVVRLDGFVRSAEGFTAQPVVMNGASEFLVAVFGEAGRHTRCAIGVNELPLGAAVEAALWVEVRD
jgi:enamine deaminase RidA (YjgF/YER057c/UK114 family)